MRHWEGTASTAKLVSGASQRVHRAVAASMTARGTGSGGRRAQTRWMLQIWQGSLGHLNCSDYCEWRQNMARFAGTRVGHRNRRPVPRGIFDTSHTENQNLPGKAISPWEGLPATKPHAWGQGVGFPYLVHGGRIPVVPLSSLTPAFGCFRHFFGFSGSFLPGFRPPLPSVVLGRVGGSRWAWALQIKFSCHTNQTNVPPL